MSNHGSNQSDSPTAATNRTMDAVVAIIILGLSAVFLFDSWRIGAGWIEGQGPGPGFFPFYICLIMGAASLVILVRALAGLEEGGAEAFVSRLALTRVLLVLVPTLLYVLAIQFLGIYVASAVFIAGFMMASKEHWAKALLIGLATPVLLFVMFEKWFLVPLPKGPIEAMLGF